MADFNYARAVRTADKLIRKFGGAGKIIRPQSSGGVRPTPLPPLEVDCQCVVVDYTDRERAATNIKMGARRALISPRNLPVEVALTDSIVAPDGQTYRIVPPMTILKPKDIIVLYDLQVEI